jgi:hypothetical protein
MKEQFMIKTKSIFVFVLGFAAILSVGCATKYNNVDFLNPYYISPITAEEEGGKKIPVSIRVKQLDYISPSIESSGLGFTLAMIPIVSAIPNSDLPHLVVPILVRTFVVVSVSSPRRFIVTPTLTISSPVSVPLIT